MISHPVIHFLMPATNAGIRTGDLRKQLKQAVRLTLSLNGMPENSELTVQVGTNEAIQELNRIYLGIDAPTDVLAFPADEVNPETGQPYLGDIYISLPYASMQADQAGHGVEEELNLLVVHGTLHLLGFDHADEQGKSAMWAAQQQALEGLGRLTKV